jgi:hypothetical protein
MDTKLDWDPLVGALRNEMHEKGRLIGLLNRQTELCIAATPQRTSGWKSKFVANWS